MSDHLAPFALRAAFPPSPAGRDSGDYYEASVAMGLAPGRRSRVRPCRTVQRDVGVPLISFNALAGRRSAPRRLCRPPSTPTQGTAPVTDVFPADGNLHPLEIGLHAIQPSPYHAGPPSAPPLTPGPSRRVCWHALVPFTFRHPGKPSDPETSLRVPPGSTGDTTERLAAHKVRSIFQRCRPRRSLVSMPRRAMRGMMPRSRSQVRWATES
jgi:hypothetical protein